MDDLPPVLKVAQAARYLQIASRSVRELFFMGRLRGFCFGKAIRLDRDSVIAFGRGEVPESRCQTGVTNERLQKGRQRRSLGC